MKILFAIRKDYLDKKGGDTVQMLKTKEYLEKNHNVEINVITDKKELQNFQEAEIVHVFNLQTIDISLEFIEEAKRLGKKVAFSTIYWNLWHSMIIGKYFNLTGTIKGIRLLEYFESIGRIVWKKIARYESYLSPSYIQKRQKALIKSDCLLPNSYEELQCICNDMNLEEQQFESKTFVVPNAIEININNTVDNIIDVSDYVLVVGRLEPNKNQLSVLLALDNYPEVPIVFVGRTEENSLTAIKYRKLLEKLAKKRGNVIILDEIEHSRVDTLYKNASVHVLASFRESPGLVSLEALKNNCKIVVSNEKFCPIDYYQFKEYAQVCNPYNLESIRNAIFEAIKHKKVLFDIKKYSYEKAAELTYKAYLEIS